MRHWCGCLVVPTGFFELAHEVRRVVGWFPLSG